MQLFIERLVSFLSREFAVMFTAALPVIELRGAIPVGISLGLSPLHAAVLGFIGSMIPVPFVLFSIRPIFNYLKKTRFFRKFVDSITNRSMAKSGNVKKYGLWGLILFVAIPIPGTGVWTGSVIAAMLNMRFKWAFPAIFIGNLIAGILIMILSEGLFNMIT
ncbi:MAG: small multi-drug export protein [Clostridiales bacterium]|nr:small multi-drug export protein [Clostridiales bacterium]